MLVRSWRDYDHSVEDDVCIVGAGPVGVALALACAQQGLRVTLMEAGGEAPHPATILERSATAYPPARHASDTVANCEALGGSSFWWGGRCVPFDEIDFAPRPHLPEARWPVTLSEIASFCQQAAVYFGCDARFDTDPDGDEDIRFDTLERWTPERNMAVRHQAELAQSPTLRVVLNSVVSELDLGENGERVRSVGGTGWRIKARRFVLACGGLGCARLLLTTQRRWPHHFGGADGPLGRFYMGHISGKIATLQLSVPEESGEHDFFRDGKGFARRRFTLTAQAQRREKLQNVAFWLDNPPFHDAAHGNALLSMVWLALATPVLGPRLVSEGIRQLHLGPEPRRAGAHLCNVLAQPVSGAATLLRILHERYVQKPPRPGFLLRSGSGKYALHYHAEHAPNAASRVSLSDTHDAAGIPTLKVDFRYQQCDVDSVLRAHDVLDRGLRNCGVGALVYGAPAAERSAQIWAQAADGFHQIGVTRMGAPGRGVVDTHCRVHGIDNLYTASSGVFPSSGQASPTFLAVALAQRLAAHLGMLAAARPLAVCA